MKVSTGGSPMDTLTVQLAEPFQDHHYASGFVQGVDIENDCSHQNISFSYSGNRGT